MRKYHVTSTRDADNDVLRHYLYIRNVLMNPQAADAYLIDFDETLEVLSRSAGSLRIGEHPVMRARRLRRINFMRHEYFMVYRVEDEEAQIIAVGHFDEDIQNVIK